MISPTHFNNPVWETPLLPHIPSQVEEIKTPYIALTNRTNQDWQFLFETIEDIPSPFAKNQDYDFTRLEGRKWEPVIVPGSLIMQGYDIQNNVEYYYRREITIPKDYANQRVFLRFEGVYSNARIWINNQYIKTHVGGFTQWDCDITSFAQEEEITLVIGIADIEGENIGIWNPAGELVGDSAWASFYAHHNICGILRDVTLYALPKSYIARTYINTELDETYKNAQLQLDVQLHTIAEVLTIKTELWDGQNQLVQSEENPVDQAYLDSWSFPKDELTMHPDEDWIKANKEAYENDKKFEACYINQSYTTPKECKVYSAHIKMDVQAPKLWDAEHPYLYEVRISLWQGDEMLQENRQKIGFRQICYGGMRGTDSNKLYINGREIKLRGVCRHDVSHLYGRSITNEDIRHEIQSYKKHNLNHLRTSHYPASEYLLQVCDELGIYVEQENSACFKGDNGRGIENPPQDFINSFAEMIESARNHPSIIIWSLANESGFEKTYAFRTEYNYAKAVDRTRPVIFSYPYTVQSEPKPYDIYSHHYKEVYSDLGNQDMPVLHDEFAHIPCYNLKDLRRDNSCREFWGESMKMGWENIFETDGALGCAIWGGIDDIFFIPKGTSESHQEHTKGRAAGYGAWGAILDAYKREKPEAYLTKKAYSPIRLDEVKSTFGKDIILYVKNWFDHTYLNEIRLICTDDKGMVLYNDFIQEAIQPHQEGIITLSDLHVQAEIIQVDFYFGELLVDCYCLNQRKEQAPTAPISLKQAFETIEDEAMIQFKASKVNVTIDKETGKMKIKGLNGAEGTIVGPYFYLNEEEIQVAQTQKVAYTTQDGLAIITLEEVYENGLVAQFEMVFDAEAIHTTVRVLNEGTEITKVDQFGAKYTLLDEVEAVAWHRKGLYSTYPENHIGRNEGIAYLTRKDVAKDDIYGVKPEWDWSQDMTDYFLFEDTINKVTNDFRTKRNRIKDYTVHFTNGHTLSLTTSCDEIGAFVEHVITKEHVMHSLYITYGTYYEGIGWGNYYGEQVQLESQNEMTFKLA